MDIEIDNGIVLTLGDIPSGEWFKLVGDIAKSGNECYMAIASFNGEGNGRVRAFVSSNGVLYSYPTETKVARLYQVSPLVLSTNSGDS